MAIFGYGLGSELIKYCQQLTYIRETFPLKAAKILSDFFENADFSILDGFINTQTNPPKTFANFVKDKELILKDLVNVDKDSYSKKIPANIANPNWKDFETSMLNDAKYSFWLDSYSNSPKERQRFIEALVDNKNPGGAYIILALLIEMGYFSNILTTNFDDFINDALLYYTSTRPRFYADDELSQYISVYSGKPNIIKLHGDYRYANIKNTADETFRLSVKMEEKLKELLQNFDLIVIGYNGADYSIMNVLQQAKSPNCELLWCGKNENNVHWRVANLINSTENSWFVKANSFDDIIKDLYINFIQSPPDLVTKAQRRQDEIKDFVLEYSQELQKDIGTSDKEKNDLKNKDILWSLYTKAISEKDNLKTIKLCKEILDIDPTYHNAYNLQGVAQSEIENHQDAIESYNKALEIRPNNATVYINRGNSFFYLKQYEKAISDLSQAIRIDKSVAVAYISRGNVYTFLGKYEEAKNDFEMAVQLNSTDPNLLNGLGFLHLKKKEYDLAILDFHRTIDGNPLFPYPHKHLGNVYFDLGEFEKALEHLDIAVKLKNDYVEAYQLRAKVYHSLNDVIKAEQDEEKANSFN
jgi:tetratricopeptide (TPR) repeat protein